MSKVLVLDIESNGLLDSITTIHCICLGDPITGEQWEFGPPDLQQALAMIQSADTLVAHNGIAFDYVALHRILNWKPRQDQVLLDTIIWAKLAFSDRAEDDFRSGRPEVVSLAGGHSLDDWGVRLGIHKAKYEGGWEKFTPEMLDYCRQDVAVTCELYRYLSRQPVSQKALTDEHLFAWETERMSRRGIPFDVEGARKLLGDLEETSEGIAEALRQIIPAKVTEMKSPEYWVVRWPNGSVSSFDTKSEADAYRKSVGVKPKDWRIEKGPPRRQIDEFNPGSRKQIRDVLFQRHGWTSPKLTETGEKLLKEGESYEDLVGDYGSVSEDVLRGLPYPEADRLADYLMVDKMIGMVGRGDNSWLRFVDQDGRIRHRLDSIGCATMRCSHSRPNVAQVPSVTLDKATGKPLEGIPGRFGWESRSLFMPSEGYILVGSDLQAIEARVLAHYLYPYDGGKYVNQVLHGDIHQLNVDSLKAIGGFTVPRSDSKTLYYGWSYGAGDEKLGKVVCGVSPEASEEYQRLFRYYGSRNDARKASFLAYREVGAKVRQSLEEGIEGFEDLLSQVKKSASRGYLTPLDGRRIPVRKEHAAINTLIQGSAAIIAKQWTILTFREVRRKALNAHLLLHIHDEMQSEVLPEHVTSYTETVLRSITHAGEHYRLNIPLTGEVKTGHNWAETH